MEKEKEGMEKEVSRHFEGNKISFMKAVTKF